MHDMEWRIVDHLLEMEGLFPIECVKAEFEAQGMEPDELRRLNAIAHRAQMGVALKVGGAEAVTDIKLALKEGVAGIIFPMVETPYALQKALEAAKEFISAGERKHLHLAVNVETETAVMNLGKILDVGTKNGLDAVTLGRVDLVGSLGLGRDQINSEDIFELARQTGMMVKEAGLMMTIGGGIEVESFDFIRRLAELNILDRFETRMIVFSSQLANDERLYKQAIKMAHQFEILWSEYWAAKYQEQSRQHSKRLGMLKKRVGDN